MRKFLCGANGSNNSINNKMTTQGNIRLAELFPYVLVFKISMKLKAFHVTQNETPKVFKNSASANKLSQNLAEQVIISLSCFITKSYVFHHQKLIPCLQSVESTAETGFISSIMWEEIVVIINLSGVRDIFLLFCDHHDT